VSNVTAFMYMGELVEIGPTEQMFTSPKDRKTDDYVTGRFWLMATSNEKHPGAENCGRSERVRRSEPETSGGSGDSI